MLLFWEEGIPYWKVGLGYAFVGIGVGFASTPAAHSLTGSVPPARVGMASGTADLQRDLGGALMQSIFGALLAAGYASAMTAAIGSSPDAKEVTNTTKTELTKSFSSAADNRPAVPAVREPDHCCREELLPEGRPVGVHRRCHCGSGRRRNRVPLVPEEGP